MNFEVFTDYSPLEIQLHWATAVAAFFLGVAVFALPKGRRAHKILGWTYVVMMAITAGSAAFIRSFPEDAGMPNLFGYTPIHLFIPLTVFGIGGALVAIRNKDVHRHRARMVGTFVGALIIAGAFTFIPGRRMFALFFGY